MRKTKEILFSLLEAIAYGFFGTIFVLIVDFTEKYLYYAHCNSNFSCGGDASRGIPPGGVLIGAIFSVIFWNLVLGKLKDSNFTKWLLILLTSSISALLLQLTVFILEGDMTVEQIISAYLPERIRELLGLDLMIKLFVILTPFTILFANRRTIIEKFKNRNALK